MGGCKPASAAVGAPRNKGHLFKQQAFKKQAFKPMSSTPTEDSLSPHHFTKLKSLEGQSIIDVLLGLNLHEMSSSIIASDLLPGKYWLIHPRGS